MRGGRLLHELRSLGDICQARGTQITHARLPHLFRVIVDIPPKDITRNDRFTHVWPAGKLDTSRQVSMTIRTQIQSILLAGKQHGPLGKIGDNTLIRELGHWLDGAVVGRGVVCPWVPGQGTSIRECTIDLVSGVTDLIRDVVFVLVILWAVSRLQFRTAFYFDACEGVSPEGVGSEGILVLFHGFGSSINLILNGQSNLDAVAV